MKIDEIALFVFRDHIFGDAGNRFLNGLKKVKVWERNNRCIKVSGMRLKAFLPESGRSGI